MNSPIRQFINMEPVDIKMVINLLKFKKNMPDSGCIVYSMNAIVLWVCSEFLSIGDWEYEDWVDQPTAKWIHPEDLELVKVLREGYRTKKRIDFYFRLLDSKDKYFWLKGIAFPCPDTEKIFAVGTKVHAPMPELIKEDMFIKNIN